MTGQGVFKRGEYELLDWRYFYRLFESLKLKFDKNVHFHFDIKTRKQKIPVTKELYKQVIDAYFNVYFNELYYYKKPKYFFLSGLIVKVRSRAFFNIKLKKFTDHPTIGFMWYERPALSYATNILMQKKNDNYSKLGKIEKHYLIHNDYNVLMSLNKMIIRLVSTNKMYKTSC